MSETIDVPKFKNFAKILFSIRAICLKTYFVSCIPFQVTFSFLPPAVIFIVCMENFTNIELYKFIL